MKKYIKVYNFSIFIFGYNYYIFKKIIDMKHLN